MGRTDAEAEAPLIWPHDAKSQLLGKEPDTGKEVDDRGRGCWITSPTPRAYSNSCPSSW